MTQIKTFDKDFNVVSVTTVDFQKLNSDDPIAYYFGQQDGKRNKKVLKREIRELATEYKRGYNEFSNIKI